MAPQRCNWYHASVRIGTAVSLELVQVWMMLIQRYQQKIWDYLWWVEKYLYLCNRLLLIIDAFGSQSSMRCVAIISCSECALFGDGVTLWSGGRMR